MSWTCAWSIEEDEIAWQARQRLGSDKLAAIEVAPLLPLRTVKGIRSRLGNLRTLRLPVEDEAELSPYVPPIRDNTNWDGRCECGNVMFKTYDLEAGDGWVCGVCGKER